MRERRCCSLPPLSLFWLLFWLKGEQYVAVLCILKVVRGSLDATDKLRGRPEKVDNAMESVLLLRSTSTCIYGVE